MEVDAKPREEQPAPTKRGDSLKGKKVAPKQVQASPSAKEEDQPLEGSRYPTRQRKAPGEQWMSRTLPQQEREDEEHANVAINE